MSRFTQRLATAALVLCCTLFHAPSASADAAVSSCGGDGQVPCTIAPATYVGQKPKTCPAGSEYSVTQGGSCWRCPAGTRRTAGLANGPNACVKPAGEEFKPAIKHGAAAGPFKGRCPRGQSAAEGWCYSCPDGFSRKIIRPLTSAEACVRPLPAVHQSAEFVGSLTCPPGSLPSMVDGGTCWSCPSGYNRTAALANAPHACEAAVFAGLGEFAGKCDDGFTNIRGTCKRIGECGASGQRPCLLGERVPSCQDNLKENFKKNICEPLRPGESPFFGGLSSLMEFYGDGIRGACKKGIGAIRFDEQKPIGIGANCTKDVFTGTACEVVAKLLGAEVADMANSALEAGPSAAEFKNAVDVEYKRAPCNTFAENLAPATRHGKADGVTCPAGQFWDLNGFCYTCPSDYTRTLFSVDSPKACVDKPGGELVHSACSVYKTIETKFAQGAQCTVEVLQSGVFTDEPINFSSGSRELCLSVGELAYAVLDIVVGKASPQKKKEKLIGSLQRFAKAANDARGAAQDAISVTTSGVDVVKSFESLTSCK